MSFDGERRPSLAWHRRAAAYCFHRAHHSLKTRMVLLFVLLALAMTATFLFGMQKALSSGWRDAARPLLIDYVDRLVADLGEPPDVARAQALVDRLPLRVRISGPVVTWESPIPDGESAQASPWDWQLRRHTPDADAALAEPHLLTRVLTDGHRVDLALDTSFWHQRPRRVGWATLAVLLGFMALAYGLVRRWLRPVDDIAAGARRFGQGDFSQPIAVRRHDQGSELGELAGTINTMGADIHQMLEAKRGLLLAISHELRSPLTRARLNTELLPDDDEASRAQREALMRDLGVMRDLIADLLESERLGRGHAALQTAPLDLAALVHEVVAELPASPVVVRVEVSPTLPRALVLDRTRMRLLLRNLLDNAVRHSAGTTEQAPMVSAQVHGSALLITVRDFGPGVDEAHLSRLCEPFYRPDSARTRMAGGVGLGLSLCRLVAQAHGGTLTLSHAHPGLQVQVSLPVR
jgi:signal transduction histidine kinase